VKENFQFKLEKHLTCSIDDDHVNGSLTVIWRDWDQILQNTPKMVYVSSVEPGGIKGPHIHIKRNSYFTCIHGKVVFILQTNEGEFLEIESSAENPVMVYVPKNMASAHINLSDSSSTVLALADLAWRPNDQEMKNTTFTNYDWKKWI
jgi:dTDP-4-dehydrorhamnose 3,5-epimerase